ncbi:phytoene/squalene synthase family protein [Bartonella sp. HY329]|uniref:phytoene/squalene synthase family protein n=1 Tax=unclassified Bartonella TaxID=2645622 RepID=UPI0021C5E102|nr:MULTISPECIES: phytoene/squalene synthase family protein [unclassified Bartonella]UXM94057.1 phytoene/squalene synthase family protein [Bartonella sp. HY329]UXN08379.1 phytoene/squalene synthase family protein [Bartonella sp. HY328]
MDNTQYCMQLLKQGDFDRYIALLFAPRQKRAGLAALFAFNHEIARIRNVVKEPLAGEVRLRWWADNIERANSEPTQNPVLDALLEAINTYDLPKKVLIDACEARIFDLYNDSFSTIADFEGYCGETQSILLKLACQIIDEFEAQNSNDACGYGGVTAVLMQMIQFLPMITAEHQLYIPDEILNAVGVKREDITADSENSEQKSRLITAITAFSFEHYNDFKAAEQKLKPSLRPIFLPLTLAPHYIKQAQRADYKAFTEHFELSHLKRQWLILKTAITGNFAR